MSSSQHLVVVPGTFACSNFSYMPLANSSRAVVAKLRAYLEWAKADPKVADIHYALHALHTCAPVPLCLSPSTVTLLHARVYVSTCWFGQVIAMFPWHVNWLPAGGSPCDMRLGATDIPGVLAELEKIANWIKATISGSNN